MPPSATPMDQFCEEDRAARRRRLNKQAQKACRARKRERRRLDEDGQSSAPPGDAIPSSPHIQTERGDSAVEVSPRQSDSRLGCADDILAMLAAGALPDFFSTDPTLDHDPTGLIFDEWYCNAVSQDTQQHLPPLPDSHAPDVESEQRDDRHGEDSNSSLLPDLDRVDGANRCFDAVDLADCDIRMELEARVRELNAKIRDLAVLLGKWGNGHMVS